MRIFITGGTGFIGKHLIKKLSKNKNNELLVLSCNPKKNSFLESNNIKVINGNLSNIDEWKEKLAEFDPEAAIHMAWEGIPDYSAEKSIRNLRYGLDLFTLLADIGCKKIICTGSCWEYGKNRGSITEENTVSSHNAFTTAKNSLHLMGKYLAKEKGIQFIWTRLFYVYGEGQRETSIIPYIIECVKKGKEPEIKTPLAKNDFVYVKDVADAICMLANEKDADGTYNIGSGKSISVQDIIKIVYDMLNIRYEKKANLFKANNILHDDLWADISKIEKEIGWKPKFTILEGIKNTIENNK